jgi:hypothetical protein
MSDDLSIEELIINDSFANYCFQNNEEDVLFWEAYIRTYPSEKEKIAEAMRIVLGLHTMLKKEYEGQNDIQSTAIKGIADAGYKPVIRKIARYAAAIAAVLLLVIGIKNYPGRDSSVHNLSKEPTGKMATGKIIADNVSVYTTAKGEKKTFLLPDNTKINLDAGSTLRVEKGFGNNNRSVYLSGEALFDVVQNKDLPFIVHIDKYDVKVLGTLFNVKAYPTEKTSETSLIRGKVEVFIKNISEGIMLSPNQKVIFNNNSGDSLAGYTVHSSSRLRGGLAVLPVSYNKDIIVIETEWAQNKLEIVNESFGDMKEKLERWYNGKITFKDTEVSKYTFSATFESESISQVLQALQSAYRFNYTIEANEIAIFK